MKNEIQLNSLILLKPKDAAKTLNLGVSKLYKLVRNGEIPYRRVGGSVRFTLDDLRSYVNQISVDMHPIDFGSFKEHVKS